MGIKLGKKQILQCFDALNQKLAAHDQHGEILVCGGASMALLFDNTTVTKDIDAVILSTEMKNEISRYAEEIGAEQGLDDGWFNEAAKGYINLAWERKEISRYSNLAVYSVSAEQLLAMKLSAARIDARDMEDSIKLMKHLGLQRVDEALEILERNMPGRTLTAKNEYFTRETFAEYQEKEKAMDQKRLFIDMDGTLAVFTPVDTLETLYERGYYANLQPHENVIQGVRQFLQENEDTEVYIMSSVLADSPYALDEKNAWLDKYLPEVEPGHRLFPPCGQSKADFVPEGIKETDYLLDDYSVNLHQWEAAGGCGVKLMNGINGSKGSWKGSRIEHRLPAGHITDCLEAVTDGRPIAYIMPGMRRNQHIETMDAESRSSIEQAVWLAEIREGYEGKELTEKVAEAMSNRLSAIEESLHIEISPKAQQKKEIQSIENGGESYMVLAEKARDQGSQKDLLLMRGDGYFIIASGFDEETQIWEQGRYFGQGEEALANASLAFSDGYFSTYFANLPLKEQFKAVLEAELPEAFGDEELQDDLYEQFMEEDNESGFFSEGFRHEIQETLSREKEKENDHGWEME